MHLCNPETEGMRRRELMRGWSSFRRYSVEARSWFKSGGIYKVTEVILLGGDGSGKIFESLEAIAQFSHIQL